MEMLEEFSLAFGMKVNVTKSRVMCSRFIHMEHKRALKAISSISCVRLSTYFGFSIYYPRESSPRGIELYF